MKIGAVDVEQFLIGTVGVLLLLAAWFAVLVWCARLVVSDKETWLDRLIFGKGK